MYSFPNLETVHCSMFSSVSSWPAYRFLRRQVRWSYYGRVTHIVKGFVIVNQTEVDVFLEFSCFFCDPMDVGTLISGSSAFSKYSLNIRKFLVHKLLKPVLGNFKHYFASMRDECNCAVVWTFFDIALLWDWNENVATAEFSKLAGILSAALPKHHLSGFEIAQLEFHHLH